MQISCKRFKVNRFLVFLFFVFLATLPGASQAARNPLQTNATPAFLDDKSFPDMLDFDPNNPVIPHGDAVKIAVAPPFSGPAAIDGQYNFLYFQRTTCPVPTPPGRSANSDVKYALHLTAEVVEMFRRQK